jgi:glyoxylase-like metal-dependent hydrolase (beta-lactamase superfamily II)
MLPAAFAATEERAMPQLLERLSLGALEVVALSDGVRTMPFAGFFGDAPPAELARALALASAGQLLPVNFGSFLVRGDGHTTLIDTGFGAHGRQPGVLGGGELLQRLAEAGIRRGDIDRVVHTHLHLDHCGWNLDDDAGGAFTFPNATFHLHEAELAYWTGPASDGNQMAEGVRGRINPLVAAGRVQTFAGAEHALPGALTLLHTPGHTPGHIAPLLASQGQHLLIVGAPRTTPPTSSTTTGCRTSTSIALPRSARAGCSPRSPPIATHS